MVSQSTQNRMTTVGGRLGIVDAYLTSYLWRIAQDKGVSKAQVALAWILSQNDEITTIPGTRKVHRLEENLGALEVELTESDLAIIAEHLPPVTVGERY